MFECFKEYLRESTKKMTLFNQAFVASILLTPCLPWNKTIEHTFHNS